jgi:hypothetical protein
MLPNGTVLMNLPANHRLFPLADTHGEGLDERAHRRHRSRRRPRANPRSAPTFSHRRREQLRLGPAVVRADLGRGVLPLQLPGPVDGRFVYRKAFGDFVNASGGREGEGAVENFEKVVLENPMPPIKGFVRPEGAVDVALPKTATELDSVWKSWMLELRDEQQGKLERVRPYLDWARAALLAGDLEAAPGTLREGAGGRAVRRGRAGSSSRDFLADKLKNPDRAAKLALEGAAVAPGSGQGARPQGHRRGERLLARYDPKREQPGSAAKGHGRGRARHCGALRGRRAAPARDGRGVAHGPRTSTSRSSLRPTSGRAASRAASRCASGSSPTTRRASRAGTPGATGPFKAAGTFLDAKFGEYSGTEFDYQMLALQRVTSGDYSLEADVLAQRGECNFTGLVFGRKDANNFHALVFFPGAPRKEASKAVDNAWVDLASFYGGGSTKTWRHVPVAADTLADGQSGTGRWHKLRIDVAGAQIDCWVDGELVASHDFGSRDVLGGAMGLLQGRGRARFKDVRFLARDPRDPAAALERAVRMEKLRSTFGEAVGGSYSGLVPPFPSVARWLQEPRTSWQEAGLAPQLLVLWSIEQNELIPLDEWLCDLHTRHEKIGLRIVSIASAWDDGKIASYLASHRFPGAAGLDEREAAGLGTTHRRFFIERFNLPRLLLLDIDGKVVWEGDPGFKIGDKFAPGLESFLDAPLAELIARRKLDVLHGWLEIWRTRGAAQLHAGEFAEAWSMMQVARELDGQLAPEAVDVQRQLALLDALFADLPTEAARLEKAGRGAALRTLVEWAAKAGVVPDKVLAAKLKPVLEGTQVANWDRALKLVETYGARIERDAAAGPELATKLAGIKGDFAAELAAEVREAGTDVAKLRAVLAAAAKLPARWLARERFGW